MYSGKANIISELQAKILHLEGFKSACSTGMDLSLGPIKHAFPNGAFPLSAVHEFLPDGPEDAAAMDGFVTGLLSSLVGSNGATLWVSASRSVFPPALKSFGLEPDRIIFVDVPNEKGVIWVMEEALKCGALTAVVGEMKHMDFKVSRRLQLAVEQSGVTGFVLRSHCSKLNPTACVSRWKIRSLPGEAIDGLPGVGFPHWRVELLRVRNGKPGAWEVKWMDGRFQPGHKSPSLPEEHLRYAHSPGADKEKKKAG